MDDSLEAKLDKMIRLLEAISEKLGDDGSRFSISDKLDGIEVKLDGIENKLSDIDMTLTAIDTSLTT